MPQFFGELMKKLISVSMLMLLASTSFAGDERTYICNDFIAPYTLKSIAAHPGFTYSVTVVDKMPMLGARTEKITLRKQDAKGLNVSIDFKEIEISLEKRSYTVFSNEINEIVQIEVADDIYAVEGYENNIVITDTKNNQAFCLKK
jgi:hypothetical protein